MLVLTFTACDDLKQTPRTPLAAICRSYRGSFRSDASEGYAFDRFDRPGWLAVLDAER